MIGIMLKYMLNGISPSSYVKLFKISVPALSYLDINLYFCIAIVIAMTVIAMTICKLIFNA